MKNKYKLFILPLLFSCCSCTYGSYKMVKGSINSSKNSISASYDKFTGHISKKFSDKNNKYEFTITWTHFENNEGTLKVEAKKSNNSVVLEIDEEVVGGTSRFPLNFEAPYEISIIGSNHSGSFVFSWTKVI